MKRASGRRVRMAAINPAAWRSPLGSAAEMKMRAAEVGAEGESGTAGIYGGAGEKATGEGEK